MIRSLEVVVTRRATKFRFHRGSYEDAMKTVVIVHSKKALRKHILETLKDMIDPTKQMKIDPYGHDSRNNWNTHIVMWGGDVIGFTSGPLN